MNTNNEVSLSKDELIKKLQKISKLCDNVLEIKSEIDNFVPQDNYPRKFIVPVFPGDYADEEEREEWETVIDHEDKNAIEQMTEEYNRCFSPKKPKKTVVNKCQDTVTDEVDKLKKKMGCFPLVGIFVGAIALFTALFTGSSDSFTAGLNWVITVLCAGVIGYYYFKLSKAKESDAKVLKEIQRLHKEKVEYETQQYEEAMRLYESEMTSYKLRRQDFLDKYTTWRKIYLDSLAEEERISEQLENDRQAAVDIIIKKKLNPAINELEVANDLLSRDYLGAIDLIIDLLKSNRADNLKEAINVYEEIVYRERQLQLQREQEAQRRYEEELRRQEEERRYQEEKQFREDQERQRRYEEDQRRRDEEARYREETRAREAEALRRESQERERIRREEYKEHMNRVDQERKQRNAGQAQCRACINAGRCNMSIHNNAPTCAGFRPRR